MNEHEWIRTFDHPYREIPKAATTHGHLQSTRVKVPPYTTFAYMLKKNQDEIDQSHPGQLPQDTR